MAASSGSLEDAQDIGNSDEEVHTPTAPDRSAIKRNAFSELMSPSKRLATAASKTAVNTVRPKPSDVRRDGLGAYIASPERFPSSCVLYYTESMVVINDLYPKSSIHMLVIPRHHLTKLHPIDAFEQDPELLKVTREEVEKVKKMAAAELRRRFGKFSNQDQVRLKAIEDAVENDKGVLPSPESFLSKGRDWEDEILTGVHSGPSMNHLHVHVLSRDRASECMKHRKHYNSFATRFFIQLEELPLKPDDVRRQPDHGGFLHHDMVCWRCGKNFKNRFQELKRHLEVEFEEWKKI